MSTTVPSINEARIAIIGLGYVGIPLAVEFARTREVVGFDTRERRIRELSQHHDRTDQVSEDELRAAKRLRLTSNPDDLKACNVYIVTVPTPIDDHKRPDLGPLLAATETIGKALSPGDVVIYESTVYPGCTEEDCVPVLEAHSGLKYISSTTAAGGEAREAHKSAVAPAGEDGEGELLTPLTATDGDRRAVHNNPLSPNGGEGQAEHQNPLSIKGGEGQGDHQNPLSPKGGEGQGEGGFYCGYSPERVNPGDKQHGLADIVKVTSGSTPEIADFIDALYGEIITAGTHKAPSIQVAEAAKVIENTQRDLNIALVNELAIIFNKLGIDTQAVLQAAGTKWNFLPFKPGLVGGHCIGVDPYYLTHKAQIVGYQPEVILAGRRINDRMGAYVAEQVVKLMTKRKIHVVDSRILILGMAFKENCPDVRNSRVIDIVRELQSYNAHVDVYDPQVDPEEVEREYGFRTVEEPEPGVYDAVVLAVAHEEFLQMGATDYRSLCNNRDAVIYDVKSALSQALGAVRL